MIYYSLVMDAEAQHSSICQCVCQRVSSYRACCSARHALCGHPVCCWSLPMFLRIVQMCARWRSLLEMLTLIGWLALIPRRVPAEELPAVVATVQGQPIAAEDLTNALRGELLRLEIQRYQTLREKLDDLVANKIFSLEAAQRGVSVQQFVHDEISAKIQTVTPEQVQAFSQAN